MTTLSHHTVMVEGLRVHYAIGGEGPPVVLLHGWPQTLHEWRHVMPLLAERHTVIAPDLRGHGFSGRPGTGYDANQLGDDVHGLVRALDLGPVAVVGHDFGAVAGYTFAARHREAVTHLAFLEMVLPGLGIMEGAMSPQPQGQFLWHMGFQSVPDIPFTLINGHEREYLQWFFQYYAYDPTAITAEDLDHYTAAITQVGALRAGLELLPGVLHDGRADQGARRRQADDPGARLRRCQLPRPAAPAVHGAGGHRRARRRGRARRALDRRGAARLRRRRGARLHRRDVSRRRLLLISSRGRAREIGPAGEDGRGRLVERAGAVEQRRDRELVAQAPAEQQRRHVRVAGRRRDGEEVAAGAQRRGEGRQAGVGDVIRHRPGRQEDGEADAGRLGVLRASGSDTVAGERPDGTVVAGDDGGTEPAFRIGHLDDAGVVGRPEGHRLEGDLVGARPALWPDGDGAGVQRAGGGRDREARAERHPAELQGSAEDGQRPARAGRQHLALGGGDERRIARRDLGAGQLAGARLEVEGVAVRPERRRVAELLPPGLAGDRHALDVAHARPAHLLVLGQRRSAGAVAAERAASAIESSIAIFVPEPTEKWAVWTASPSSTTLASDQAPHVSRGNCCQRELLPSRPCPFRSSANTWVQ